MLPGQTVTLAPALLALDLERRGFALHLDADHQVGIQRTKDTAELTELTEDDRAAIDRWRLHLGALVGYQPPEPV